MQASRKNLSVNELLAIKRKEAKDLQAKQVSAAIKVLKTFDDFAPYKNMDEKEFIDEFNDGLYQDFVDSCLLESSGKNQYIFMINLASGISNLDKKTNLLKQVPHIIRNSFALCRGSKDRELKNPAVVANIKKLNKQYEAEVTSGKRKPDDLADSQDEGESSQEEEEEMEVQAPAKKIKAVVPSPPKKIETIKITETPAKKKKTIDTTPKKKGVIIEEDVDLTEEEKETTNGKEEIPLKNKKAIVPSVPSVQEVQRSFSNLTKSQLLETLLKFYATTICNHKNTMFAVSIDSGIFGNNFSGINHSNWKENFVSINRALTKYTDPQASLTLCISYNSHL